MSTLATREIWLCQDCTVAACNDDTTGVDDATETRIQNGLEALGYISLDSGTDTESSKTCCCCHAKTHGTYTRFAQELCNVCGRPEVEHHTKDGICIVGSCRILARKARRPGDLFYVVLVSVSRHYGGPQEGGWWYDRQVTEEVHTVSSFKQARAVVRKLREEYPKPRHDRFSMLGGTDHEVRLCAEQWEIPKDDTERPRYE